MAAAQVSNVDDLDQGDTDEDGRSEFIDPWGNPYVIFDRTAYEDSVAGVVYVRGDGARVTAAPRRANDTGFFLKPAGFQLFSMGPDGLPGTSDDVECDR
jgi:hypothetical protein